MKLGGKVMLHCGERERDREEEQVDKIVYGFTDTHTTPGIGSSSLLLAHA